VHPFDLKKNEGGVREWIFAFKEISAPGLLPEGVIYYLVVYLFVYTVW